MVNWNEWPMWGFYLVLALFLFTITFLPWEQSHLDWWDKVKEFWDAQIRSRTRGRRK